MQRWGAATTSAPCSLFLRCGTPVCWDVCRILLWVLQSPDCLQQGYASMSVLLATFTYSRRNPCSSVPWKAQILDPPIRTFSYTEQMRDVLQAKPSQSPYSHVACPRSPGSRKINLSWVKQGRGKGTEKKVDRGTKDLIEECLVHTKSTETLHTLRPLPRWKVAADCGRQEECVCMGYLLLEDPICLSEFFLNRNHIFVKKIYFNKLFFRIST